MQNIAAADHAATLDLEGIALTPRAIARRKSQRRNIFLAVGSSYLLDTGLFALYAVASTTSWATPIAFGICGLTLTSLFLMLSEAGFTDRFSDHYLSLPQNLLSSSMMLAGLYFAPEVGFAFCCIFFIIFSFAALRMSVRQAWIVWTYVAVGCAAIFLVAERPIAIPMSPGLERTVTLLFLVSIMGRCILMGLFAMSMREMLYRRSRQLREAYGRIEELAQIDELTGALNRRFVMKELQDELLRSQRSKSKCSVALIDLDWFKKINDTFGHPAGDEALRAFAITIFANIRDVDKFGRYGGEEFLLILPDTPQETAVRAIDRLRTIVANLDWTAISPGMAVTMSAGVTSFRTSDTTDSLLSRADAALYRAKEAGRNRIEAT